MELSVTLPLDEVDLKLTKAASKMTIGLISDKRKRKNFCFTIKFLSLHIHILIES
jgi:hypothetical protein